MSSLCVPQCQCKVRERRIINDSMRLPCNFELCIQSRGHDVREPHSQIVEAEGYIDLAQNNMKQVITFEYPWSKLLKCCMSIDSSSSSDCIGIVLYPSARSCAVILKRKLSPHSSALKGALNSPY